MKNIGLIDDKDNVRKTFRLKLNLIFEKSYPGWKIIDSKPFKDIEVYKSWILENEISVLILDERLIDGKLLDDTHVDYFGSDLVKYLRTTFKDIPIYCITSYEITNALKDALPFFNLILNRNKFDEDIYNYLNLFIKSGESFYNEFKKELQRVSSLSEKIANGIATENEIIEIKGLQTKLSLPHFAEELITREAFVEELEKKVSYIKKLQQDLFRHLNE